MNFTRPLPHLKAPLLQLLLRRLPSGLVLPKLGAVPGKRTFLQHHMLREAHRYSMSTCHACAKCHSMAAYTPLPSFLLSGTLRAAAPRRSEVVWWRFQSHTRSHTEHSVLHNAIPHTTVHAPSPTHLPHQCQLLLLQQTRSVLHIGGLRFHCCRCFRRRRMGLSLRLLPL